MMFLSHAPTLEQENDIGWALFLHAAHFLELFKRHSGGEGVFFFHF
jgi:hypothetical protein